MRRIFISEKNVYHDNWINVLQRKYFVNEKEKEYTVIHRNDTVIAIPIKSDGGILLINQFRYPRNSESLEFPMGSIDAGENIIDALKREFNEETGLNVKNYEKIGEFFPAPGLTDQIAHVFIVNFDGELLKESINNTEEDIDGSTILTINEIYNFINSKKITNGFTISAFLFFKLFLDKKF